MGNDDAHHHHALGASPAAAPMSPLTLNTSPAVGGPSELEAETEKHDFEQQHSPVHQNSDGVPLKRIPTSQDTLSNDPAGGGGHGNERPTLSTVQSERRGSKDVIQFLSDDPEHPNYWPIRRKLLVFFAGIASVLNSTLGSSLPSNAVPYIVEEFGVTDDLQFALPISCYLMGYIIGPILCGELPEPVLGLNHAFDHIEEFGCEAACSHVYPFLVLLCIQSLRPPC